MGDARDHAPAVGAGPSHRVRRAAVGATFALAVVAGYLGLQGCGRPSDRSPEAFCEQLSVVRDLGIHLGAYDASSLRADVPQLEKLRLVSPSSVEPDVATLVAVVRSLTDAVGPSPDGDTEDRVARVFTEHRADLDRIAAAARNVSATAKSACGVDLNPAPPAAPASPSTSTPTGSTGSAKGTTTTASVPAGR